MLFEQKSTFKDFHESAESIATNILSSKLKLLQQFDLIYQEKLPGNKKTKLYFLTKKGLLLTPILLELTIWSSNNINEFHENLNLQTGVLSSNFTNEEAFAIVLENYEKYKKSILGDKK